MIARMSTPLWRSAGPYSFTIKTALFLIGAQQGSAALVPVPVPVLALLLTLWGLFNARRTAAAVRVDVPIEQLPPAQHGFTIAQISDVHVGPTIKHG
jgi:hypothetical protein